MSAKGRSHALAGLGSWPKSTKRPAGPRAGPVPSRYPAACRVNIRLSKLDIEKKTGNTSANVGTKKTGPKTSENQRLKKIRLSALRGRT
jgi:hypothetical protein